MLRGVALIALLQLSQASSLARPVDCRLVETCGNCSATDGCAWCASSNAGDGWKFECLEDSGTCDDVAFGFTIDTPEECACVEKKVFSSCEACAATPHCSWCPEKVDHLGGCAPAVQASGLQCQFLEEEPIANVTECPS